VKCRSDLFVMILLFSTLQRRYLPTRSYHALTCLLYV